MFYLSRAIQALKPNSEFTFTDDDYATIEWQRINGEAPTQKQIDDEIKKIKSDDAKAEADKIEAKASAITKLAALGLTEEEVASILG